MKDKIERVALLFSTSKSYNAKVVSMLKKWGIEIIDCYESPDSVPFESLQERYHVIVVMDDFAGNRNGTLEFIQYVRLKGYRYPMIGLARSQSAVALQANGCNFALAISRTDDGTMLGERLNDMIPGIISALYIPSSVMA